MTSYQFSQTVRIKDKTFKLGIQEVPEEIEVTSDFLHYVRCGWVVEAPPQKVAAQPVAINEHAKALAARIEKKLAAKNAELKKNAKQAQENPHLNVAKAATPDGKVPGVTEPTSEPLHEEEAEKSEDDLDDELMEQAISDAQEEVDSEIEAEGVLTPAQKAARTRELNKKAKAAKEE